MCRLLAIALTVVMVVCCSGASADKASATSVLFVDADRVLSEALVAKDIRAQLDRRRTELQGSFNKRGEELRKDENELMKQRSILSSDAFETKVGEFRKEVEALNRDVATKMSELEDMYGHALERVYNKVRQISRRIADERGASVVLFVSQNQVSYVDTNADVSDAILESLNRDLSRVSLGD